MKILRAGNTGARPVGSVWILQRVHPGIILNTTAIGSTGTILALRLLFEGRLYDHSRSSMPGDFLLAIYLTNLGLEFRKSGIPRGIHWSTRWHRVILSSSVVIGTALQLAAWRSHGYRETPANTYHNLIVVPALTYMVVTLLPILTKSQISRNGRFAMIALFGWIALLIYDMRCGNLSKNTPG